MFVGMMVVQLVIGMFTNKGQAPQAQAAAPRGGQ